MMTQLVIFDWAGTTVDYGSFAPVHAFALAFGKFGLTPTVEEIRAPMGMLKRDHIRTMLAMPRLHQQWEEKQGSALGDAAVEKIYGVFETSLLESLSQYATPKPGVMETAAKLKEMGLFIGSTTGYTDKMMSVVAPQAAAQGYAPDAWFSPDSVRGLGRPYPYMIFANMARFQVPSVECVVKVGDTVADIQEGKHAGVRSLGVLEGSSVMGYTQAEYEALPPPSGRQPRKRPERSSSWPEQMTCWTTSPSCPSGWKHRKHNLGSMDEEPGDFYGQDLQHDARRGEIKPNLPQPLGFGDGCGDGGDQDQRRPHTADQRGHADQREQARGAATVDGVLDGFVQSVPRCGEAADEQTEEQHEKGPAPPIHDVFPVPNGISQKAQEDEEQDRGGGGHAVSEIELHAFPSSRWDCSIRRMKQSMCVCSC